MIKHFADRAEAEAHLKSAGYKEVSSGSWGNGEFRATIHPAPSSVTVFWSAL